MAKRSATTPTRVVVYTRVSTEMQAEEGHSLEAQRDRLRAYATAMGLTIVAEFEDPGESAKGLDRPGLRAALDALRSSDALLVVKLDRLTRSVRDLGELLEHRFCDRALLSCEESIDTRTAAGRLVLNVLASVAQWEREAIGERTSAVMQHMRRQGRYTGGHERYGWRLESGEYIEVPEEQATIRKARELHAAGFGARRIARELGVTRRGRPWDPTQVARLLA